MYVMTGRLIFPAWQDTEGKELEIRKFSEVYIESTFKQLTQFAEITIPRNVRFFDKMKVREIFRTGDPVIIELGYDGNNVEEFRGYITRISSDIPVKIRCEDEMWKARRIAVNYVGKNIMLGDMLKKMAPGYEVDALEVKLGDVRFSKTNLGAVLEKLQSEQKLYTYFIGKKMICGKYYAEQSGSEAAYFELEKNTVSIDLNYKNKEDIILKIDATSVSRDGKRIQVSTGDAGGDTMSLSYYNITVKAELEKKVKADYERAKRGGFDGSFTAFGIPRVDFGKKAALSSIIYPDRNGEYFIEGVNKTFNDAGYRQQIKLGGTSKLEGNG